MYKLYIFFLMIRRPPRSTRTDTLFPYTTLFRSDLDILIISLILNRRTGGNLAEVLEKASSTIRDRFRIKREVRTKTAHGRSEEHTSELQSLMRISYAVFCLKNKTIVASIQPTRLILSVPTPPTINSYSYTS